MRGRTIAAATAAAALAWVGAAEARAADIPGRYQCLQTAQGTARFEAGTITSTRAFESDGTSDDYECTTPDPAVTSAKEAWKQTGTVTCAPIEEVATGTDTFTWNTGETSVLKYSDHLIGGVDLTTGTFVSGKFNGMHVSWQGVGAPNFSDPFGSGVGIVKACGLAQATEAPSGYVGVMRIY